MAMVQTRGIMQEIMWDISQQCLNIEHQQQEHYSYRIALNKCSCFNKRAPSTFWWNIPSTLAKIGQKWAKMAEKSLLFLWTPWIQQGVCSCAGSVHELVRLPLSWRYYSVVQEWGIPILSDRDVGVNSTHWSGDFLRQYQVLGSERLLIIFNR